MSIAEYPMVATGGTTAWREAPIVPDEGSAEFAAAVERLISMARNENSLDWGAVEQLDDDGWETDES